jgi:proline racemase
MKSKLKGGVRSVATQASKLGVIPQIHGAGFVTAVGDSRISSPQCIAPKKLMIATA